jgi:hypothetical protein
MSKLADFDVNCFRIDNLIEQHKLSIFVETGCFRGHSLEYAASKSFEEIYSCDIDPEMVDNCQIKLANKDQRIKISLGDSVNYLNNLLPKLDPKKNCLFFLDAHMPGHDKRGYYDDIQLDEYTFPLEKELEIIYGTRTASKDVIIIDDLRIYEDNQYDSGNWPGRTPFNLTSAFLNKYNVDIKKYTRKEGYALLLPR